METRMRHDIPQNAILLTKMEALSNQLELIKTWNPRSEVWSLLFGRAILTSAASLTGFYINQRFRRKLKFRNFGVFPTMAGVTTGPAVATTLLYTEIILNKMLLLEISCPICLESRSILLQASTGLLLPLILVPFANFSIGARSGMHNIPHITDVKGIFRIISSVYKPMIPVIATIFTFHALLAGFITHSQIKSFLHILDVQNFIEQDRRDQKFSKAF
ncbi:uncharacterized protein LOC114930562 [Nylanderia fulva]|uniref:uncharacterized protein LOC114930562 n=1 Tax=Nylanderia fulva TaxID=613905 RepID=UPI0010FB81AA|nr:uncharacterized protein LOC114930562 [Nylanderia fulva]